MPNKMSAQFTDSVSMDQLTEEGMLVGTLIGVPIYIDSESIKLKFKREAELTNDDYQAIDEYFKNLKE